MGAESVTVGIFLLLLAMLFLLPTSAQAQPFEWQTYLAGFGGIAASNGVAVADANGDGLLDVYVVVPESYDAADSRTWSRLFLGLGGGRFRDATLESGLQGRDAGVGFSTAGNGYKMGASWGDYDGDGDADLYLTHAGPNELYRNDGGSFTNVTAEAGVAGPATYLSTSALWLDVDDDGDLDLHVATWGDYPEDGQPAAANLLYENLGDGTFQDVAAEAGVGDLGKTYTTLTFDVDGDGRLDLYNANDFGANRLYVQQADGSFREATADFGLQDHGHGMGLAVGDPNSDGRFDVFVTNISGEPGNGVEHHALFVAQEDGTFAEQAGPTGVQDTGWGWGTAFFDLDNDGDEDLFVGNGYFQANDPNALFENVAGEELLFENVAEALGVADEEPARGLAVCDYDDDGRLDLLVADRSGPPLLYRNALEGGAWLKVELEGTASHRDALGAVVEVWAEGRRHVRLHHGAQFLGQNLLPVHVGLGAAGQVDRVVVRWPSGAVDEVGALEARQSVRIVEGEGLVEGVRVATEPLPRTGLRVLDAAPQPSSGAVALRVEADAPTSVTLRIYDVLGRTVHEQRQHVSSGTSRLVWEGDTAPGVYVYALTADGNLVATGRLVRTGF